MRDMFLPGAWPENPIVIEDDDETSRIRGREELFYRAELMRAGLRMRVACTIEEEVGRIWNKDREVGSCSRYELLPTINTFSCFMIFYLK